MSTFSLTSSSVMNGNLLHLPSKMRNKSCKFSDPTVPSQVVVIIFTHMVSVVASILFSDQQR